MIFEQTKIYENFGYKLGYIFSYFLFTTVLYFILILVRKTQLSYPYVMGIALLIALIGTAIKKLLKQ